jgi:hypothetical protein
MKEDENRKKQIEGALLTENNTLSSETYSLQIVYNSDHALPRYLNVYDTSLFNMRSNISAEDTRHYEIHVHSLPWAGTNPLQGVSAMLVDFLFLVMVLFAYSLITSSCSVPLIQERETGVKQLLLISGAGKFEYLLSNFVWDILFTVPSMILTVAIFYAADTEEFGGHNFGATLLILLEYIVDSTLLSYLLSMLWTKHAKAQGKRFIVDH